MLYTILHHMMGSCDPSVLTTLRYSTATMQPINILTDDTMEYPFLLNTLLCHCSHGYHSTCCSLTKSMWVGEGIALTVDVVLCATASLGRECAFSSHFPGPVSSLVLMPLRKSGTTATQNATWNELVNLLPVEVLTPAPYSKPQ